MTVDGFWTWYFGHRLGDLTPIVIVGYVLMGVWIHMAWCWLKRRKADR